MSTTIHKETVHKEVHPGAPAYTRMTESRETIPIKDTLKDNQDIEQVAQRKFQGFRKGLAGLARRYPVALPAAAAVLMICLACFAAGQYGIGHDTRSAGEKMTDTVKSYMPTLHEEHGYGHNLLPWNWKIWHREEPKGFMEKLKDKDFDMDTTWGNLQSSMQQTRKGMEDNLKSSFDNFQTSMQKWWDAWDATAKSFKEELAKKATKAGSHLKEKLPEALQGGQTEHVHMYNPDQKTYTDTIKVHHHGYEKPEDEKKGKK